MNRRATAQPTPAAPTRVEFEINIERAAKGRRRVRSAPERREATEEAAAAPEVPKITQLLVVAYWWERLIAEGKVKDYAEIARLSGLSRARVTQIANSILLASDIQDHVLAPASEGPSRPANPRARTPSTRRDANLR